ncbi:hypothetical protein IDH44_17840 [Paenibacillus sp. IB182496]|uniref:CRISPR type III-associated protein domain-containing protein n=1 Tax=Paenibacillus sabuli TaxID=2772509 RepID=A0A927BUH7_9BACL|nr:RAMP superfamily CRISPR-associated protein [Paenibacillus sabuli]MBD2847063.1 hypothetical protein [Paenibacillus sabuli]
MSQKQRYRFTIQSVSPVHFGDGEDGEDGKAVLRNSSGEPFLCGNAIGGALRDYLRAVQVPEQDIRNCMGGVEPVKQDENTNSDKPKESFVTSSIYISDARLLKREGKREPKVYREGTAIDAHTGAALDKQKYKLEYLPVGTELSFTIEFEDQNFESFIQIWKNGIKSGALQFGGKKSNGFGCFELLKLERQVWAFQCAEDVDAYLFEGSNDHSESLSTERDEGELHAQMSFTLSGKFPYGVYQAFALSESEHSIEGTLTGLLKEGGTYVIPATSIRGLLRQQVYKLLIRMTDSTELADKKCAEMFGSKDGRGKFSFEDVKLSEVKRVVVERPEKEKDAEPTYVKIDRLTGSAFKGALKRQREIQAEAVIEIGLDAIDESHRRYVFPIVYALRLLGSGQLPIGGRTGIGLGQFYANHTVMKGHGLETSLSLSNSGRIESAVEATLRIYYKEFERWCRAE